MTTEWVLGIVATLLSGLNLFQFFFFKSEKRRQQASAASAEAEAKQKSLDIQQDHYDFLLQKLTEWEGKYYDVANKLQESLDEKLELKQQISILNNKVESQNTRIAEMSKQIASLTKKLSDKTKHV